MLLSGCGSGTTSGLTATSSSPPSTGGTGGGSASSDTTPPVVAINSPTTASSYSSTTASINLGGTASDNVGVTQVTWANSLGGSGTTSSTGSWSINSIALKSGNNIVAVTARDADGNTSTAAITISYNTASTGGGGVTYYVANNGNDANDGRSLSTPFQTIGHAKNVVNPGDTIELRSGTYTENNLLISRVGAPDAWITMRAYNNEQVTLRNTGAGPTLNFYHSLCTNIAASADPTGNTDCQPLYWIVQGLTIQGSPNGGGDGFAVKIDTPRVKLIANKLCCTVADIVKLTRGANDVEILNNEIWQDSSIVTPSGNSQGIDIVGADRTRIAYNYVHDINDYGMYSKGNARNTIFENNYLVNIGMHGIMLGQATGTQFMADGNYESYDGIARNNVIVGTGWACLATSSSFNVHIYNNSCYNTGNGGHGSILLSNESVVAGGWPGTNIEIKNNIIYSASNSPSIYISNYGGQEALSDYTTLHIDRNIYYVSSGSPRFVWNGATYTVAQWRTAYLSGTGHDDTSLVANPQYANTTMLSLNPSSPAINAGLATPYVTSDYLGTLRPQSGAADIGAYEY